MGDGSGRLRAAIVGAGMIGDLHRRGALLAGAHLVGVLASSPERSAEVAARWGADIGFASFDELLAADLDVVHVATPNALHAEQAAAVLASGRNVICEKPLGISLAEAEGLADLAAERALVATVPFVYRYHPLVREIRDRAEAGEFGRWLLLHGQYLQDWMLSPHTWSWRVDPATGGPSRAVADIGSHWCDLVEWVSGERFAELSARFTVAYPQRLRTAARSFEVATEAGEAVPVTTEDAAVLGLRTADGVLGSVVVSQGSAGRKNRVWFELDGTAASAVFDQENPERIWLGGNDSAKVLFRDPAVGSAEERRLSTLPAGHAQGYAHCFEAFVADTYAAIRGATPVGLPTFADGLRAARIVDAALRADASGGWEPI